MNAFSLKLISRHCLDFECIHVACPAENLLNFVFCLHGLEHRDCQHTSSPVKQLLHDHTNLIVSIMPGLTPLKTEEFNPTLMFQSNARLLEIKRDDPMGAEALSKQQLYKLLGTTLSPI